MKPTAEYGKEIMCLMFPIKNGVIQGDALSSMIFNFALEY